MSQAKYYSEHIVHISLEKLNNEINQLLSAENHKPIFFHVHHNQDENDSVEAILIFEANKNDNES